MDERQDDEDEPTQQTPWGATIPVPKRKDVLDALRKVARPDDSPDRESGPQE
jgi:hypothetical protein